MRRARWLLAVTVQVGVLAGLTLAVTAFYGTALDTAGVIALTVVVVLGGQALRAVTEPHVQDAPAAVPARSGGVQRPFARITVLRSRLERDARSSEHFDEVLRPLLVELADDWLRRAHGVDRRRRPEVARRLLGEELWQLVEGPRSAAPVPTFDQLEGYVARMEQP